MTFPGKSYQTDRPKVAGTFFSREMTNAKDLRSPPLLDLHYEQISIGHLLGRGLSRRKNAIHPEEDPVA